MLTKNHAILTAEVKAHFADKMHHLNDLIYDAVRAANEAVKAAENEDGAPVKAVQQIAAALRDIAAETDSVIDCGVTRKEMADMAALYKGAKQAGLV